MTDRLEQVLTELEALEQSGPGNLYLRVKLIESWPPLLAKLRAALEMERALEIAEAALEQQEKPSQSLRMSARGIARHAKAAWQQAGENELLALLTEGERRGSGAAHREQLLRSLAEARRESHENAREVGRMSQLLIDRRNERDTAIADLGRAEAQVVRLREALERVLKRRPQSEQEEPRCSRCLRTCLIRHKTATLEVSGGRLYFHDAHEQDCWEQEKTDRSILNAAPELQHYKEGKTYCPEHGGPDVGTGFFECGCKTEEKP